MKRPTLCFGGPLDGQTVEYAGPHMTHVELLRSGFALNAPGTGGSGQTVTESDKTTRYRVELFTTRQGVWDVYVHGDRPSAEDVIRKVQAANREAP